MAANYTFRLQDDDGAILSDIDVDVGYRIEAGEFVIETLTMDRQFRKTLDEGFGWKKAGAVNLLTTDEPLLKLLGKYVFAAVESDQDWQAEQLEESGWVYRGLGGNDPDGRMVRVA